MSNNIFHKMFSLFKKDESSSISQVNNLTSSSIWTEEELLEFKERLLIERDITTSEIDSLKDRISDIDEYTSNGKVESYNSDFNTFETERITSALELERLQKYLNAINKSLKRIQEGKYGICTKCNCKINKERLFAVPTTTLSASWKIQGKCPADGIDIIKTRDNNA